MDLKEIQQILKLMDRHGITEFRHEKDDERLILKRGADEDMRAAGMSLLPTAPTYVSPVAPGQPAAPAPAAPADTAAAPAPAETDANVKEIPSPMVGTFYAASNPESPPYVSVGDVINETTVVCIIEAMKIMNEIKAELSGTIVEVCVKNGQTVEFGQPLFKVKTA